jgi:hypothetical protein
MALIPWQKRFGVRRLALTSLTLTSSLAVSMASTTPEGVPAKMVSPRREKTAVIPRPPPWNLVGTEGSPFVGKGLFSCSDPSAARASTKMGVAISGLTSSRLSLRGCRRAPVTGPSNL